MADRGHLVPSRPARPRPAPALAPPTSAPRNRSLVTIVRAVGRSGALVPLLLSAGLFAVLILVPVVAIVARVLLTGDLLAVLGRPMVVAALRLSLLTTTLSLGLTLLLGTPVAYLLARYRFPGRTLLDSLIDLPIVLPPAVAGLGLLMAFGRRGLFGPALEALGLTLSFTTAAVVVAQTFVAAPFYVRAARAAFLAVDQELERVAHTLGVSAWATFWRVTVPVALPGLVSGALMSWARALGEFGATIMVAGSFPGRTQTMPLAIYAALESDLEAALALAALLVLVSLGLLGGLRRVTGPLGERADA